MAFNIRRALAELMGKEQVSDEELRAELDELKIDQRLEALQREGHLGGDPLIVEIARGALKGKVNPEQIEQLLRAPKPTPAQTTIVKPPSGPDTSTDTVEAAIQAHMAKTGEPYHQAALAVTAGATLQAPITQTPGGTN